MGCVSGKNQVTRMRFKIAKPVAHHTGKVMLNLANVVPKPGPSKKPNPKATPIRPNVLALFCEVDISASIAVAVAAVPPLIPSIILARNNRSRGRPINELGRIACQFKLIVIAKTDRPITEPKTQIIIIGFLPKRSLSAPINGATVNCEIAYVPASRPRVLPLLVNRSKRNGNKGKTIVSPRRSFNNVKKAPNNVGIFDLRRIKSFIMFK